MELSDLVDNRFLHFFRGRTGRINYVLHRLLDFPETDRYIEVQTKTGIVLAGYLGNSEVGKGFLFNGEYIKPEDLLGVKPVPIPACSKAYQ